ncbi:hypothetical protein GCM10025868_05860 [Angustibacter aerolatus]|uniref:Luciferase-like domain-containing protein n=1 Tax=Angustibacter aerolatus TaxID=1162965 RepID=A0ABQ6JCN0_9ACTN|nr:hypothetical protein GCM10025868_05860 [Angustibacter aerolatus]
MTTTPLTVLDLVPVSSGSTAGEALRNSVDLAQRAERLGYARYWFAEHHLNPGVAGTSPAVVLALTAGSTSTIRLGSGALQMGHRTALATVEDFGLLDAAHPGRFDLGLGRTGPPSKPPRQPALVGGPASESSQVVDGRTGNGLRIPPRFSPGALLSSPRFALQRRLLTLPGATSQDYTEQVDDVLALLAGTYVDAAGEEAHVVPGEGADLQVWILGSSAGESAEVAGDRGLRFAANYHVSPATVLEAVEGYRAAFRPSADLDRPHVSVSADVVVAPDEATPASSPRATGCGCAASAPPRARSRSRRRTRRAGTGGPTPTGRWCRTASTPSSWGRQRRWPTTSSGCATPPAPTSWSSPRSRTTTPTGCARTSLLADEWARR